MDVRKRKMPKTSENGNSRHPKSRNVESNKTRFYALTGLIIFTITFGVYTNLFPLNKIYTHSAKFLDGISVKLGLKSTVYAVVIDAGSTASRVLAYSFIKDDSDNSLRLYSELFVQLKPGVSAFADNPFKSRENIEKLLARAYEVVPKEHRASTSIVMKATAGLRLLPEAKANALLEEARSVLKESDFSVSPDAVSIMDGVDEGMFSWFTVNFLLDRLSGNVKSTVVALDLGGGSTQISFAPADRNFLRPEDQEYIHSISVFHQNLDVYSHSYLGLGLQEARRRILEVGNPEKSFILRSECINPIVNTTWQYGGKEYTVQGPKDGEYEKASDSLKNPIVRFEKCRNVIKSVVGHLNKPLELNRREIYAFSYYFDRAADSGLIDVDKGGVIKVEDFLKTAQVKCKIANTDQPFLCLDLTYISVLLLDGFGLNASTKLHITKWVDNHEISWALGAAFHLLQNGS